jgi:hypothetical protein
MEAEEAKPSMIHPHWSLYSMCFPYGPKAEEEAGKGRTVRLAVRPVENGDERG